MIQSRLTPLAFLAAFAIAAPAAALVAPPAPRAAIPFANKDGILDWQVQDASTVYVHAMGGKWYRADLFQPCPNLPFGATIGFRTSPDGSFDRYSAIVVRGVDCPLKALTVVAGPPEKPKKPAK